MDDVAALDWALILSRFPIVKVRSVSGDYSFILLMTLQCYAASQSLVPIRGGAQPFVVA